MLNVRICLHAQLIRLFRRAGRIDEVGPYLSRAEKATPAAPFHAGLSFCKGLLARYCNKPYDAIMVCLPSFLPNFQNSVIFSTIFKWTLILENQLLHNQTVVCQLRSSLLFDLSYQMDNGISSKLGACYSSSLSYLQDLYHFPCNCKVFSRDMSAWETFLRKTQATPFGPIYTHVPLIVFSHVAIVSSRIKKPCCSTFQCLSHGMWNMWSGLMLPKHYCWWYAYSKETLSFCPTLKRHWVNKNTRGNLLQMMNNARVDVDWGRPAIFAMVMIYLNIDNELGWEEANLEGPTVTSVEAIKIAHKLLKESRWTFWILFLPSLYDCLNGVKYNIWWHECPDHLNEHYTPIFGMATKQRTTLHYD